MDQVQKEIKVFNKATIEILSIANIKSNVFNQSCELFLISSENALLKSTQTSMYSPFIFDRSMSITQARQILTNLVDKILLLLRELRHFIPTKQLLVIADSLMTDSLYAEQIEIEQWRAACFRYGLQEDPEALM